MNPDVKPRDPIVAPPGDRRSWIVSLLDGMATREAVSAVFGDHPLPLLDWLATARFGEFSAGFRPGPSGCWMVTLTKR